MRYTLAQRQSAFTLALRLYGRSIREGELCLHAVRLMTAPGSTGQVTHLVTNLWDHSKAGQAILPLQIFDL